MTAVVSPGMATTRSGAPLPLVALPQGELLTVNIDQIPLVKDMVAPGIYIQTLRLDPERGEWVIRRVIGHPPRHSRDGRMSQSRLRRTSTPLAAPADQGISNQPRGGECDR